MNTPAQRTAAAAWLSWMLEHEKHSRTTLSRLLRCSTSVVDRVVEQHSSVAARSWARAVHAHEEWSAAALTVMPPSVDAAIAKGSDS